MKKTGAWLAILLLVLAGLLLFSMQKDPPSPGIELRGVKVTHCTEEIDGVEQFGIRFDTRYRFLPECNYPEGTTFVFQAEFPEDLFHLLGVNYMSLAEFTYWKEPALFQDAVIREKSTTCYLGSTQPEYGVLNELFQPMRFTVHCYMNGELLFSQEVSSNL